jgi:hypothetical protein
VLPAETVLIALDQVPGASAFVCYPEDYDELEKELVPPSVREDVKYSAYYLTISVSDIDAHFDRLPPAERTPQNRLPERRRPGHDAL